MEVFLFSTLCTLVIEYNCALIIFFSYSLKNLLFDVYFPLSSSTIFVYFLLYILLGYLVLPGFNSKELRLQKTVWLNTNSQLFVLKTWYGFIMNEINLKSYVI